MSQQTRFDTSTSRTLTMMCKIVQQLRLESYVIKEKHPATTKMNIVRQSL